MEELLIALLERISNKIPEISLIDEGLRTTGSTGR